MSLLVRVNGDGHSYIRVVAEAPISIRAGEDKAGGNMPPMPLLCRGMLEQLTPVLPVFGGGPLRARQLQGVVCNIRGSQWTAGPRDSPKRDWHSISCLAAVISRFDVVALQESRRNPKALKHLLATLGPRWQVIVSDVTEGLAGNGGRLAYLYDSERVRPSGLVGEIVLPPVGDDPERQFAPTPYTASFTRDGVEFILASVHVL